MILTVTINPMLDKTVEVRAVRRGAVERASGMGLVVGGKGINVSRQLKHLGVDTLATGFLGGEIGSLLERLLRAEGIPHAMEHVAGMTREGVTYREKGGTITAVFEPPHSVTAKEARSLVRRCEGLLSRCSWIVCSGSSPCPQADGVFGRILRLAAARGVPTVLDSYGPALRAGLRGKPTILKMNRTEYEQTFGFRARGQRVLVGSLRELLAQTGAEACVLTDGARPVLALMEDRIFTVTPPRVKAVNPTGSGDSMLAGLLYGLLRGWPFGQSLRFGAAAGAANARRWDVAVARAPELRELARRTTVSEQTSTVPFLRKRPLYGITS